MAVTNEPISAVLAPGPSPARYVNLWAFFLAAAAMVAVVAANQLDIQGHHFSVALLNANWQFSWSHDLDTLILAWGMLSAAAAARSGGRQGRLWWAIAAILGLFVIDEGSPLHRDVDRLQVHHFALGKALYSPILVALVLCLWRLAAGTEQRAIVKVGVLTLCVCFSMHVLGLYLLRPLGHYNPVYQLGVGVKEGTELAGLILVILGLARLARRRNDGGPSEVPI